MTFYSPEEVIIAYNEGELIFMLQLKLNLMMYVDGEPVRNH